MIIERAQLEAALPHYEIGDPIGRGAHGLVFAARHRQLGSARAVKALVVAESDEPGSSRRFRTEARVMTALDHPHVVRVHEYAEDDSVWLLVMEYLGGGTLTERMRRPVTPEQGCAWVLAVADGLSVAHARGIVHRDIKPANLLFTADGLLKVGDFGIAKLFAGSDASASVDIVGTPRYVAPEQITGDRIGPPTDIYALGITLYELLSGRSPFPSQLTLPGLLHHHMSVPPETLDEAPPQLAALTMRALAKDPADRPATAREFALSLVAAADHDLGRDWVQRSGVPLRIDNQLLKRGAGSSGETTVSFPAVLPAPRRSPEIERHTNLSALGDPMVPPAWLPAGSPPPSSSLSEGSEPVSAVAAEVPTGRRSRRRPWAVAAAAAVALVAVVGTAVAVTGSPSTTSVSAPSSGSRSSPSSSRSPSVEPTATVPTRATAAGSFTTGDGLNVQRLAFSPDATHLAWVDTKGRVRIWSATTGRQLGPLATGAGIFTWSLAYNSDGSRLATGQDDGDVRIWDTSTGKLVGSPHRGHRGDVLSVAFSHDDTVLASGGGDHTVRLWNAFSGATEGAALTGHRGNIDAVAFDATGNRLVSASDEGARLWDLRAGKLIKVLPGSGSIYELRFSPDGTMVAGVSNGGSVRLWDGSTGAAIGTAIDAGPSGNGLTLGFNEDSSQLVTCAGNTIRWWDTTTGRRLGNPLTVHTSDTLTMLAFNRDSTRLALASSDGTVRTWKLS